MIAAEQHKQHKRRRHRATRRIYKNKTPGPGETTPTPESLRRLKSGVSLNQVNRGTGISISHLSRVFNGERKFGSDNLRAVAAFLGVSTDRVLEELARVE